MRNKSWETTAVMRSNTVMRNMSCWEATLSWWETSHDEKQHCNTEKTTFSWRETAMSLWETSFEIESACPTMFLSSILIPVVTKTIGENRRGRFPPDYLNKKTEYRGHENRAGSARFTGRSRRFYFQFCQICYRDNPQMLQLQTEQINSVWIWTPDQVTGAWHYCHWVLALTFIPQNMELDHSPQTHQGRRIDGVMNSFIIHVSFRIRNIICQRWDLYISLSTWFFFFKHLGNHGWRNLNVVFENWTCVPAGEYYLSTSQTL